MSEPLMFPDWKRTQAHSKLPVIHERVLWVTGNRTLRAFLSISLDVARLVLRVDEGEQLFVVALSKSAEGISSLARAQTWADWVIADFFASNPRKRAPRRVSRDEKEAA